MTLTQALPEYWAQFDKVSATHVSLNYFEKLWAAWYAYMGNDVLATGIMSFTLHEVVYFGRSLPWIIIDCIPAFNKYKLQGQKIPTAWEQWQCALLVLLSHVTVELPQIWYVFFSLPENQHLSVSVSKAFPPTLPVLRNVDNGAIPTLVEDCLSNRNLLCP